MRNGYVVDAKDRINLSGRIKECWQRRDLIRALSLRDIKVRYTQTILGMAWAVINPLISLLLLLFVFQVVIKVDTGGIPHILFTVSGLVGWNYFSKVVGEAGLSVVGAQELVRKIYFPRLVIPISKALSAVVDLVVVLVFLIILFLVYQYPVNVNLLWIFPCLLFLFFISLGCGIWVAALTIRFRDFHHIVPVLLRIGMFVSPIAFGSKLVPPAYKWLISLNPLTGIIDGFRYALFQTPLDPSVLMISGLTGIALSISGLYYFLHMEKYIADII